MSVTGHCHACGDFTRIDHRTSLCEWCEDQADRVADPLWDDDGCFFVGSLPTWEANHAL